MNAIKNQEVSAIAAQSAQVERDPAPWPRLQCRSSSPDECAVVFPLVRVQNPSRLLDRVRQILLEETDLGAAHRS